MKTILAIVVVAVLVCFFSFFAGSTYAKEPRTQQTTPIVVPKIKQQLNPDVINLAEWKNRQLTEKDKQELLAAHNKYRAELKLPFLEWDEELSKSAQEWAFRIRNAHALVHSFRGGENLWAGSKDMFTYSQMIDNWGSEKQYYAGGRSFPEVGINGQPGLEILHYTQIVWRKTKRVGCGIATNSTRDYLVCHYDPVGNIIGEPVAALQEGKTRAIAS